MNFFTRVCVELSRENIIRMTSIPKENIKFDHGVENRGVFVLMHFREKKQHSLTIADEKSCSLYRSNFFNNTFTGEETRCRVHMKNIII
jgi:hypothetical protein